MLVVTLVLAAVGFALLVVALMTGSVIWAWGCIAVCILGAILLLVSALAGKRTPPAPGKRTPPAPGERTPPASGRHTGADSGRRAAADGEPGSMPPSGEGD